MFGGAGVYRDGRMFGLVSDGELFLKADELTLSRFREAGCRPFTYEKNGRPVEMSYFSVPEEALEVRDLLAGWVSVACEAAARTKRPARKRA